MTPLSRGLYETLLTEALQQRLNHPQLQGEPEVNELRAAEAGDRIALHLASVVERAIAGLPDEKRVQLGIEVARKLIQIVTQDTKVDSLVAEQPAAPARILRAVRHR